MPVYGLFFCFSGHNFAAPLEREKWLQLVVAKILIN